jgi:hypothetical protein
MKLSPAEQDQLAQLLTRIYFDIVEIEMRFGLMIGGGDWRPRIEYFHDAVRAFTSKEPLAGDGTSRLNIEWLAYDLQCLRYLQSMPLSPFQPHQELSPHTEIVEVKPKSLAVASARPDRATKERLVEQYQHYAILFAALLKPFADNDFHARTDAAHQDAQTLHALIQQFEKNANIRAVADSVNHLEDDALRNALRQFLENGQHKKKPEVKKLLATLKGQIKKKNKELAGVEKAHMDYGLAQLGIYEDAKDTVKKMASSGMNLAGKFVESAIAETRREMGR